MQRVSVVGTSGAGKSTLGKALAARIGAVSSSWTRCTTSPAGCRCRGSSGAGSARRWPGERWVIDGNYSSKVRDLVWARADTVVWLDLPQAHGDAADHLAVVAAGGQAGELWNGNREHWRNLFSLDKEESVIAWAWQTHARNRTKYAAAMADPANVELRFVRLKSPAEVRRFLVVSVVRRRLAPRARR